ncbi:hypothetical protein [Bacteroides sp.]
MKRALFIIAFCAPVWLIAQNTTNSPGSMFGLGELSTGTGGQFAGFGGSGIALRGATFINTSNPASLTELAKQHFVLDAGLMGAYNSYTQTGVTNKSIVGNLNNLSIGCRIMPRWYGAVFLAPVSSVGYAITLDQEIEGTSGSTISSLFEGTGYLSKIGLSNAFLIGKNLSLGVNLSYVTGTITQSETQGSTTLEESSYKHAFYADFGIQYKYPITRDKFVLIGATYGYSQHLTQNNDLTVTSTASSETIEKDQKAYSQYLPQFIGAGVSYNSLRWTVTADYKYIDWSRMKSSKSTVSFANQHQWSAGAAYTINNPYKKPVKLLLGTGLSNPYVAIKHQKAQNCYISTGANFTTRNNNTVSIGLKYSDQFKIPSGLPREKGLSLFLNISFSERTYRAKLQ